MIELSKKELKYQFDWTNKQQVAFDIIKDLVIISLILTYFDHSKRSYVEVDSSDYVYEEVLS